MFEDYDDILTEAELRRRGRRGVARRAPRLRGSRHRRGRPRRSRPRPRRGRRRRPLLVDRRRLRRPRARASEFVRWVQATLNRVLHERLTVTGVMDAATRDAVREFQRRHGLPVDGIVGPPTEDALITAARNDEQGEPAGDDSELDKVLFEIALADLDDAEGEEEGFLGFPWPFSAAPGIIDRTAYSPKSKRKRMRDIDTVYALVLHQTAFSRGNDPARYDNVTAHFVILPNGTIIRLHPEEAHLYASNGFNRGSVAVEFVGNFPDTRGRWWRPDKFGRNHVSEEQIAAGRQLVRYLIGKIGLTHVLAHRQSSGTRGNDPGPDIWKGVGQWAVNTLGLKDGGPGFKVGTGSPIPDEWRNWARSEERELEPSTFD